MKIKLASLSATKQIKLAFFIFNNEKLATLIHNNEEKTGIFICNKTDKTGIFFFNNEKLAFPPPLYPMVDLY